MKTNPRGDRLIQQMLTDPAQFNGNELLKEYFKGFSLDTLKPLLLNTDHAVRRSAVWIASELGRLGRPLVDTAITLIRDDDPYIRFYALDVIAVCSFAEDIRKYGHVARFLEDRHEYIRTHVMFLISNADVSQLKAAALFFSSDDPHNQSHIIGLACLADEHVDTKAISSMITSHDPLLRKYGAIATWRTRDNFPELFSGLATSRDPDIKKFWERRRPKGKS